MATKKKNPDKLTGVVKESIEEEENKDLTPEEIEAHNRAVATNRRLRLIIKP